MLDCSSNSEKAISVRSKVGGTKAHQAPVRTDSHNSAHCNIMPSETLPLGPSPNMLRVASVKIPLLNCSTKAITTYESMKGRTSHTMSDSVFAPERRAISTWSRVLRLLAWARTALAVHGQLVIPM